MDRAARLKRNVLQLVVLAVVQLELPGPGARLGNRNDAGGCGRAERRCFEFADRPGRNELPCFVIEAVWPGEKGVGTINGDAVERREAIGKAHDRGFAFLLAGEDFDGRGGGNGVQASPFLHDLQGDAADLRRLAEFFLLHDVRVALRDAEERRILDLRVVVHDDHEAEFLHRGGEPHGVVSEVDPAGIVQERALGDQVPAARVIDFHLLVEILRGGLDPQADDLRFGGIRDAGRVHACRDAHGAVREGLEPGDGRGIIRFYGPGTVKLLLLADDERTEFPVRTDDADAVRDHSGLAVDVGVDRERRNVTCVFRDDDILEKWERGGLLRGKPGRGSQQEVCRGAQEFDVMDGFHRMRLLSVQTAHTARPRRQARRR